MDIAELCITISTRNNLNMNWNFNHKLYNRNINQAGLNTTLFVVFMPYVKVESYHMDVCYTLSFIIKSNIGDETQ